MPEHAENLDRVVDAARRRRSAWARPRSASGWRGASRTARSWCKTDATLADIAVLEARPPRAAGGERRGGAAALLPARLRRRARARPRRRDHRAPAAAVRVQEPAAGRPRRPGRARVALQPRADGQGRLPARDREQPRARGAGGGAPSRRATAPTSRSASTPSLQAAMEAAFEGRSGSAVALDPETGEILAMTSTPAYDPNQFTTGIEPARVGEPRERSRHAAHQPRDPGLVRAGQHVQGDRRDGCARGGPDHARRPRSTARGSSTSTTPSSAAIRGATASSTCGARSRSPATSTSTRSGSGSRSLGSRSGRS